MTLVAGTRIGAYEIIDALGAGGIARCIAPVTQRCRGSCRYRRTLDIGPDGFLMSVPIQPGSTFMFGNPIRVVDTTPYMAAGQGRGFERIVPVN